MATTKNDQPRVDTTGTTSDNPTAGQREVIRAFTPGPWTWVTHPSGAKFIGGEPSMKFLVGADGQGFAHTVGLSEPTDRANADLMVAAPDLYAALQECVLRLGTLIAVAGEFSDVNAKALDLASAALAKAEGR